MDSEYTGKSYRLKKENDPNPGKDRDVQQGYDEHQKKHREKQDREERKKKGEIEEPYKVDNSGTPVRGTDKDET